MKYVVILIGVALIAALVATSSVLHGQVDFATAPAFEYEFGSYNAIMLFKTSTVLRLHGGTWLIAPVPFYVLTLSLATARIFSTIAAVAASAGRGFCGSTASGSRSM